MDHRPSSLRRIPADEFLQHKPTRPTSDTHVGIRGTSTSMNLTDPSCGKFSEKELMHGLNDRLAGFIEKVHHLEHQNQLLERELEEIRGRAKPASCLEEEYGAELRKLRQLVQEITHQKHQIETEHQNLEDDLSNLRRLHEREARGRADAESNIVILKKDISDAYRAKLELDRKAQALVDEIHFLKRNHEAEVSEMFDRIQDAQETVKAHGFGDPGVTAALRDIRAQLEGHTVSDLQQAGETFRAQFARLTEAAETKREALKASQQEIQEYRRRLQAKNIELDCAKGTREVLERQLHDVEDRHNEEMIHYQTTIKELENELINCKFDMSGYLREYQDLLNVKMALDVEILSYRKLLCGEEARLSVLSGTPISLPYIYHQSPVYTLPCLSRPGGPHRRVEPQYKFVEEIITETTREIEMSDFEETGMEETEEENNEQQCSKRGREGSEEEKDNEDGREEGGEQMSDDEQDQVASQGNSVNGGEQDDGEKDEKNKKESEENEAINNEKRRGKDKNSQSTVLESKVAENTKAETEAAMTEATVQRNVSSKAADLKPEVSAEKDVLRKSDDAEKDVSVSAQAKKSVDDTSSQASKESDKTQGRHSAVQDKVRASDFTAGTKNTVLIKEEEPLEKGQGATFKSQDKENNDTETKEINNAVNGEDKVAKSIQDAKHDSYKGQETVSSLQSNVKSSPEEKDQKPNSGDKPRTVQTVMPQLKKDTTSGIKELHLGEKESSQVQKSKPLEVSEKTNYPQGKTETLESSKSEK